MRQFELHIMSILVFSFKTDKLLFRRNSSIWRKSLVCTTSVASYQNRWYNKIILRKGYLILRDFSWIENYKLIHELYIIISNKISGVHFCFWQYILDWIKDNALKSLTECIAIIIASFNLAKAKWFWRRRRTIFLKTKT